MRRLTFVVAAALVCAIAAPVSAAGPIHVKLEPNPSFVVTGACVFAYELTELRVHGNLLDFVDNAGQFRKTIIAGNFVVKVTNLETDNAITLNISGQFIFTPNPDGSLRLAAHGRNLFFTIDPEPFTVFHRGRAVLTVTPSGDMLGLVFNEVSGQSLDICQALGAI
jgi:hypothetical protein